TLTFTCSLPPFFAAGLCCPAMSETAHRKRGGRPFHSILEPHFDFIRELRQRRKTWQEIADLLFTEKGIRVTHHAPFLFYRRKLKRAAKPHWEGESNFVKLQTIHPSAMASAAQPPVATPNENGHHRKPTLAATPQPLPFRKPNPDEIQLNDPTKILP
ncbi:MAG: hypothetical protein ACREFE_11300, partial [Limisphaerales bacterium]